MSGPVVDTWDTWQIGNKVPIHTEYSAMGATKGLATGLHTVHGYLTYQFYKVGTIILITQMRKSASKAPCPSSHKGKFGSNATRV